MLSMKLSADKNSLALLTSQAPVLQEHTRYSWPRLNLENDGGASKGESQVAPSRRGN